MVLLPRTGPRAADVAGSSAVPSDYGAGELRQVRAVPDHHRIGLGLHQGRRRDAVVDYFTEPGVHVESYARLLDEHFRVADDPIHMLPLRSVLLARRSVSYSTIRTSSSCREASFCEREATKPLLLGRISQKCAGKMSGT